MSRRSNNSLLVESAVALAEAETCSRPSLSGGPRSARIHTAGVKRIVGDRGRRWTTEEDEFLRRNVGWISQDEIARQLGRSRTAVHLRRERDLHLPCPRRHPEWLTCEQIAVGLGIDGKSVALLIDRGILPGRRLPMRVVMRVVDKKTALDWIADPMHWIYFDTERVGRFRLQGKRRMGLPDIVFWRQARKAVDARRKTWKDAWLRPGEVVRLLGINDSGRINLAIHRGILHAVRWGNWRILRSEAERFARERIRRVKWGNRMINYIRFSDKPRLPNFSQMSKKEMAAFHRKRLQSEFYQRLRRRNVEIRTRLRKGQMPGALARRYRLTVERIKQIGRK